MLKLTSELKVSINMLNILDHSPTPASEMYEELGVSKSYLNNTIQKLSRAGVIKTTTGNGGGVSLLLPDPTLYDLALAFYPIAGGFDETKNDQRVNSIYIECLKYINIRNIEL